MSKKTRKEDKPIVDVQSAYSKTELYVEENRKTLTIITVLLVVLFAGYFAYTRLYLGPRNQESSELMWKAEYWFEIDSLDKALYGDDTHYGFAYIADEYGNTKAGNLAKYYMGTIFLKQGDYQAAIAALDDANLDDEMVAAMAKGLTGDAWVELGNYDKALSAYKDAVSHSDNSFTAPLYLKKSGLVLEELGKFDEALEKYQTIKDNYPKSTQAQSIDSYIARVGG